VCDLETSRIGAPYIYDISNLRVKYSMEYRFWEDSIWEKRLLWKLKSQEEEYETKEKQ